MLAKHCLVPIQTCLKRISRCKQINSWNKIERDNPLKGNWAYEPHRFLCNDYEIDNN